MVQVKAVISYDLQRRVDLLQLIVTPDVWYICCCNCNCNSHCYDSSFNLKITCVFAVLTYASKPLATIAQGTKSVSFIIQLAYTPVQK